ncbi:hypothetical protein DSL72_001832 [Monilinia vaccinii-corymbosi]|uniref:Uncharacterized protein n=1 Tax=Monilinia vaccinii-corymbosi TaxID=61207 RepID=A0A8A3PAY1_9HELO|nr:hypothetical protein DSL72_001832 [Monilinia vaccinii-corymbosi]
MTFAQPESVGSLGGDDVQEPLLPAETSGQSSVTSCDMAAPLTEQNSQRYIHARGMADSNPGARTPSSNSQLSQNSESAPRVKAAADVSHVTDPKTKRSRSPSPFSASPQAPPSKRRVPASPIKPWIKNEHLFREVEDKLSFHGLGPYDVPVASDKWLPFNVQSKILTRTQNVVEDALFVFLHKNWPETCVENGWEEMGEAELDELAPAMIAGMQAHKDDIAGLIDGENSHISDRLSYLLEKIGQIRHCAVHRTKRIPVIVVELMVRDATYITTYLKDDERAKILDSLCRSLEQLSLNLQARFGDKLLGRVERKLKRTNAEIEKIKEALRIEEKRERQSQLQLEDIKVQDEGIYEDELEALKEALEEFWRR